MGEHRLARGGAPIENQRTLRTHLVLDVAIPQEASLFQALTLAFWRFQGLAATTPFTAVLQALEARARAELEARLPGRFRHKGTQPWRWHLPFGQVRLPLVKLWDPRGRTAPRPTACPPLVQSKDTPRVHRRGHRRDPRAP